MNPHFIFNSVQNIRSLINDKQEKAAVDYLDKFSKLTRQVLENSEENYIAMDEEVEMIENYLSIQQLLYSNKFEFDITVDEAIDTESVFLPPMLTQPFIENAIKHGLGDTGEGNRISIRFYLKEARLFFEVLDNGKGFGKGTKSSSHKSMAMKITGERLTHYTKNKDFSIQTDNITGIDGTIAGAKVHFEIPYIYEK
ncbi:MAG: histidine kinase [Flavobacterium sp. JAD_PAG50586_2]|nr:MAG: histidine kinase [Flavobacterium sp. JAD_PAG50586_2]